MPKRLVVTININTELCHLTVTLQRFKARRVLSSGNAGTVSVQVKGRVALHCDTCAELASSGNSPSRGGSRFLLHQDFAVSKFNDTKATDKTFCHYISVKEKVGILYLVTEIRNFCLKSGKSRGILLLD